MAQAFASGSKHSLTGTSSSVLYTDRRQFYLDEKVVKELWADVTPFISFLGQLKTRKSNDPDWKSFEHRSKFINQEGYIRTAIDWDSGGFDATKASVTIYTASTGSGEMPFLNKGDMVEIRAKATGSRNSGTAVAATVQKDQVVAVAVVVACVHTASTSTVVTLEALSSDGSDIYDIQDGDPCTVIGAAWEEHGLSPEAWSDELEVVWNSAQITKTPVEISGTMMEMALRGYTDEFNRLVLEKSREHKMKLNRQALLGWRIGGNGAPAHFNDATSGRPVRTTMGIIPMINKYGTANQQIFSRAWGSYTVDEFINDMEAMAQYDNAKVEKFAFAGSSVLAELSKIGPNSFMARSGSSMSMSDWKTTDMGFDIRTLTHPFGKLHIVWDPTLRYAPYNNHMVIVDPDNVERVVFRASKYETNIQANDRDGRKDQYFSDEGVNLTLVEKNGLFKFS